MWVRYIAGRCIGDNVVVVGSCVGSVDGLVVDFCYKVFFVINHTSCRVGASC